MKFQEHKLNEPTILISSNNFSIKIDMPSFEKAMCLGKHLNRCYESFLEEKNSLQTRLSKNVEAIFHNSYFKYYDQTIVGILEYKNGIEPGKNFLNTLKLDVLTLTLEEILVGVFSLSKANDFSVKQVAYYMNFMMIERIKFLLEDEIKIKTTRQLMLNIRNHEKLLTSFNLFDNRFDIIFFYLVIIHKKLFFNESLNEINKVLNQLGSNFQQKVRNLIDLKPIRAFLTIVRGYISEFIPYNEIISFNVFLIDGFRKYYYYFANYFRFLFEKRIYDFDFESSLYLLDELSYLNRETEKIISEVNFNFRKNIGNIPELTYFKKLLTPLNQLVYAAIKRKIRQRIQEKVVSCDFDAFNLVDLVNENLSKSYEEISKVSIYYSMSLWKTFLANILETLLSILSKDPKWKTDQKNLIKTIEEISKNFEEQMDEQEFMSFRVFFENILSFFRETKKSKCQNQLLNSVQSMEDNMIIATFEAIIRLKDYSNLEFKQSDVDAFFVNLMKQKSKGNESLEQTKLKKSKAIAKLYIVKAVTIFYCSLLSIRNNSSDYMMSVIENKKSWHSLIQNFDIGVVRSFSEYFKKFSIKRDSFFFA